MRPLQLLKLRIQVRRELQRHGYSNSLINEVIGEVNTPNVQKCAAEVGIQEFGDGSLIDLIREFFKSPAGQALLDALVKMLLALLMGLVAVKIAIE